MYCKKCGAELESGAAFCEKCGERVSVPSEGDQSKNNVQQAVNVAQNASFVSDALQAHPTAESEKKKSKKLSIIIPVCVAIVAAIAVCLWLFVFNKGSSEHVNFYSLATGSVINYDKKTELAGKTEWVLFGDRYERYDYDENGNLVVFCNGGYDTVFTYDESGRLVGEYRGDGYKVSYVYSEESEKIENAYLEDSLGNSFVVYYSYNNQDNSVVLKTYAEYTGEIYNTVTYNYSEGGLIEEVVSSGPITSYPEGSKIGTEIGAGETKTTYEYNNSGDVVGSTYENKLTYTIEDQELQELLLNEETKYDYDSEGNLISSEGSNSLIMILQDGSSSSSIDSYNYKMEYENGLCVRATATAGSGDYEETTVYEYEYNENGEYLRYNTIESEE